MNTPNNAAALERLDMVIGSLRNFADVADRCVITEVVNSIPAMRVWAEELSEIRATLAQPDALTSQPSGEAVGFVTSDGFPALHQRGVPPPGSSLYANPSADAPGVAVDEWRPIETAPKESPYWVVWSAYYQRPVVVTQRSNDNTYWEGDWDFDVQATHWTAALAPKPEGEL